MKELIAVLGLLASLTGCGLLGGQQEVSPEPPPTDPNQSMVLSAQGNLGMHQTARTSLLEDNEHLRDLLTKALAEKRKTEFSLADAEIDRTRLTAEVGAGKDSIESLSEQISTLKEQLRKITADADLLTKERKTLAEMYAVEKRQRLAFEKELLEREIAERTHDQEGQ